MDTKKYIIEIPDNTAWLQWVKVSDKDGHVCFDFKDPEDLTLYTEPDLEQVRKEAYEEGYKLGYYSDGYQRGLNDAWEAARKIVHLQWDGAWAGVDEVEKWFDTYTASEAIEKIRQHEQEQEEIKVGDEVEAVAGKAVIIQVFGNGDVRYMYPDASIGFNDSCSITRTGRHFPEIAEVLKKMQEKKE